MARDEIVAKLDSFLRRHAPMTEECHGVYLMVELRKLLQQTNTARQFRIVVFYADWTVHHRKDRTTAEMSAVADALYSSAVSAIRQLQPPRGNVEALRGFIHMDALRSDMAGAFHLHHINDALTTSPAHWAAFARQLV